MSAPRYGVTLRALALVHTFSKSGRSICGDARWSPRTTGWTSRKAVDQAIRESDRLTWCEECQEVEADRRYLRNMSPEERAKHDSDGVLSQRGPRYGGGGAAGRRPLINPVGTRR